MSILEVVGLYVIIGALLAAADAAWTARHFKWWPWAAQDALAWILAWPLVVAAVLALGIADSVRVSTRSI
jgi:hypothetical protein